MTIKLTISYDGSNFLGWQKQNYTKHSKLSVETTFSKALDDIYNESVKINYASRTDAGVHAKAQVVSFNPPFDIPLNNLKKALNSKLPFSVRVMLAKYVDADFSARYFAKGKVYIYRLKNGEIDTPFEYPFCYHVSNKLDLQKIKESAKVFCGEHDFGAYTTSHEARESKITTIFKIRVYKRNNMIYFGIFGKNFLHKMIRFIVGSLIGVGTGVISKEQIQNSLDSGAKDFPIKVVPGKGLFLKRVIY